MFDRHKKQIVNYCYRFCGNSAVAEELAQETFLRVYKAAPRYRPTAKFRTWLYKIASNICLNEIRRPVYRTRLESLEQSHEIGTGAGQQPGTENAPTRPDALLEAHELNAKVLEAMQGLPQQQRAALLLRVHEAFSYREIGLQIKCSENQVKTLIHRGRQRLKKLLSHYLGENHE